MYQRILVAIDNSHSTPRALDEALKLAGIHRAELHLVTVINLLEVAVDEPRSHDTSRLTSQADAQGEAILAPALAQAASHSGPVHPAVRHCWEGGKDIAHALLVHAKEINADLIVMGTHGRHGLRHALLGSVAEYVMRESHLPVLVVRSAH